MISSQDVPKSKRQKRRVTEEKRLEKQRAERKKTDDWSQADSEFNDFSMTVLKTDQENDDFVPNPEK